MDKGGRKKKRIGGVTASFKLFLNKRSSPWQAFLPCRRDFKGQLIICLERMWIQWRGGQQKLEIRGAEEGQAAQGQKCWDGQTGWGRQRVGKRWQIGCSEAEGWNNMEKWLEGSDRLPTRQPRLSVPWCTCCFLGARHTGGWGEERELKLSRDFAQEQRRGMGAVLWVSRG